MRAVLFLDFDGVIVESVGIKDAAFRALLPEYPEAVDELMEYHLAHNAVSRYEKFRYIVESILGQEYTEEWATKLRIRFEEATHRRIVACDFVPGALEFLEHFQGRLPIFLVSATPSAELGRIIEERKLRRYFEGIYGAPEPKTSVIARLLSEKQFSPSQAVFVGDSREDLESARTAGIGFVGRSGLTRFASMGAPEGADMFEVLPLVETMLAIIRERHPRAIV